MTEEPSTDDLLQTAMERHGATMVRPLRDGGQKRVALVDRGGENQVLKLVLVGSSSPDALERAHREVQLLTEIDDPHVVKVTSGLVEIGSPVLAASWLEQYLDGDDLASHLGQEWDWAESRRMALEVGTGLVQLHSRGIVHRDLSASNVRRISSGTYVVMDPGFARHTLKSGITIGGQPGTPGFLTPEHLQSYSGSPTPASDVFGIGILVFASLTGRLPFPDDTDTADYFIRVTEGRREDLASLRPDLAPDQIRLVNRMLHPQSARRFLDARDMLKALEDIS